MIEDAIKLAVFLHSGQVDKQNMPYILHPLRVMARVQAAVGLKEPYLITAVLHDVVEDTQITLEDLKKAGYTDEVVQAVDSVTKRKGENYISFVRRSSQNQIGRVVKIADVTDNHERIPHHMNSKWWAKLGTKYAVALAILKEDYAWLGANSELVAGMEAS